MDNFYTVLVIPEKTKKVRKMVLPSVYVRVGLVLGAVGVFFLAFMVYDYVNVMRQLSENRRLRTENRQLKQEMQEFASKLQAVQDSLDRIQNYTTKLRIITNQAGEGVDTLKKKIDPGFQGIPMDDHSDLPPANSIPSGRESAIYLQRRFLLASNNDQDAIAVAVAQQAALQEQPKSLNDLVKQEEEKESPELREEFQKLREAFEKILTNSNAVELDVQSLHSALIDQMDYLNSLPTLKPTNGWYTSGFGVRNSPYTNKPTMHEGLDLANHVGSAIVSPAYGVVTYADSRPGYGNLITIDHGYGLQTQYGHISRFYVKVGEKVHRGQKIAAVGSTGRSTGPHVHYEIRVNGIPVDPYYYILED